VLGGAVVVGAYDIIGGTGGVRCSLTYLIA
jgi:hypothetical protein